MKPKKPKVKRYPRVYFITDRGLVCRLIDKETSTVVSMETGNTITNYKIPEDAVFYREDEVVIIKRLKGKSYGKWRKFNDDVIRMNKARDIEREKYEIWKIKNMDKHPRNHDGLCRMGGPDGLYDVNE